MALASAGAKGDKPLELRAEDVAFFIDPSRAEEAIRSAAPESGGAEWGKAVIGQPRAIEALRMGVRVRSKGYNVHVSGAPGTGRRTAVLRALEEVPASAETLRDIVYVYDFDAPLQPRALVLPPGGGKAFKRDLHRMVEALKNIVRLQAESAAARREGTDLAGEFEAKENALLASLETELLSDGFKSVQIEAGGGLAMDIVHPLRPCRPKIDEPEGSARQNVSDHYSNSVESFEALQAKVAAGEMTQEAYDELRRRWYGHMDRMKRLFAELRKGRIEMEEREEELRARIIAPQVAAEASLIAEKWKAYKIQSWVETLEKDIMAHLFLFAPDGGSPARAGADEAPPGALRREHPCGSRGPDQGALVMESHPNAVNLFGTVEPRPEDEGDTRTAFLRIRAGSFLRASGGFLVLRAEDVLADEEAWLRLKRALQDGRADIQSREGPLGPGGWLKPEAPEADVKVIMIGGESSYDILYQADPDFQKLFKVHAEFDSSMPMNDIALMDYAAFARRVCEDEALAPLDAGGLAAVIEQGARLAEYRERLSTRFGMIADLLRESDYRSRLAGSASIGAERCAAPSTLGRGSPTSPKRRSRT